MYYTDRLMLRAIDPDSDALTFLQWKNDAAHLWNMSPDLPMPMTRAGAKAFCEQMAKRETGLPFFMVCEKPQHPPPELSPGDDLFVAEGKPRYPAIGVLNFQTYQKTLSFTNPVAIIGILLYGEHNKSRGLGTELLTWGMDFAFKSMALHKVTLRVHASNERACRCYRKVGFVEEGRHRAEFWKDGKWEDILYMGLLREEWLEKHP